MIGLNFNNIISFMYIITNINNKKCFFKPKNNSKNGGF